MKISFQNIDKNKMNKLILTTCMALIIIIPLLMIWQGLDFTDIGYSLTCYQQIFNDPSCIAYCLPNWMQYVIGGIWMKLFNSLGLMGINLGGVFIIWLTAFFTYRILKKYVEKTILAIGLTITTIYSLSYIVMIHYDNLSALFFIITIFLIMRYIDRNNVFYLFAAGIIECINTLVRLPNILGFIFLLAVIINNIDKRQKFKRQIKDIIIFITGFITAFALSLLIMKQMNYLNIFIDGIYDLFKVSSTKGNIHNGSTLTDKFFTSNGFAIGYSSLILFCTLIICFLLSKIKKRKIYFTLIFAVIIFSFLFIDLHVINFIVGISYFICSLYMFNIVKSNNNFRLITILGILLLLIAPVGTTIGQSVTVYTSWITIPIIMSFLINLYKNGSILNIEIRSPKFNNIFSVSNSTLKLISILLSILMFFYVVKNTYKFTYRDSSDRFSMTYNINNKYLKYTYTTHDRAQAANDLLNALSKYVHKNDFLWAEGSMSTVYYATETKPFVSNPWDSSLELPLENALNKAKSEKYTLPVIIKQNVSTGDSDWPQEFCKWTDNYGISAKHNKIVDKFIKKYNYKLVWNSTYFKIYTTSEKNIK